MRGVPNRVFLTEGYMAVFFTFLLLRWCPFLRAQMVSTCLLRRVIVTCRSCNE